MIDSDISAELLPLAQRLTRLARADLDLRHEAALRRRLLERHAELRRPARAGLALPLAALRRLAIAAPSALAVAAAAALLAWSAFGPGHRAPATVEAAQISRALAQAAPTLTSWQVSVQTLGRSAASADACEMPLKSGQRLYLRDGRAYLYSHGHWQEITVNPLDRHCLAQLQWPFATFAADLAANRVTILPGQSRIDGRVALQVAARSQGIGDTVIDIRAWVEPASGLVLRVERVIRRHGVVTQRTLADYQYAYRGGR